jgi:hypothetical protein
MVRAWVALAEGNRDGRARSSSTTVEMPRRPSSIASISPHGPAPTIATTGPFCCTAPIAFKLSSTALYNSGPAKRGIKP